MCCCFLSSSHPCSPLQPPISRLLEPIFQPGTGEAAQRGQTSSPCTLPRCLSCPALRPPFCTSRWPSSLEGKGVMREAGLSTAGLRAFLVQTPAPGPRPHASSAVPVLGASSLLREACSYAFSPSLQEDCCSETQDASAEDPPAARAWRWAGGELPPAAAVCSTGACTSVLSSSPSRGAFSLAQISGGGREQALCWAPFWKGTVELPM